MPAALPASRRLSQITALFILGAGLSACAMLGEDTGAGSPFTQALSRNYAALAEQAAQVPGASAQDEGYLDSLFGIFDSPTANPAAQLFTVKADRAGQGEEIAPEPAGGDFQAQSMRARLIRALETGREAQPDVAARAQADFDCWMIDSKMPGLEEEARACRAALNNPLAALEGARRPVAQFTPPAQTFTPPPLPAPVAQAPANYTVLFDFDSWTLTAEDLTVITNVINTARAGGQSRITVVGHTDTSGDAAYNQKLSVHRANVVMEALVDLGARRAAIQVSGVGESDLAVATEDGVKEARNRRAVVDLLP